EAMRRRYLEGIREGTRERHTADTQELPPELRERLEGAGENSSAKEAFVPPPAYAPSPAARDDEDADWDPSDYFSRPSPVEPEPDLLEDD
ncbi:MAG TPA: hypothetical protein VK116_11370, partial [Planctomycetota bacterium]|nr:hypothetical protein [Planctomycetota bacterium]